jgi:Ca2+:H+ antiporter
VFVVSIPRTKPFRSLIFPRWDVIAIILSVFLMTYTYIEAKSNYHRGSILILR